MKEQKQETTQDLEQKHARYQAPDSLLEKVLNRTENLHQASQLQEKETLTAHLQHTSWEMRVGALCGMEKVGEVYSHISLIAALSDEHPMVRVTAIRILGRVGDRNALGHVILALQDQAWEVREIAVQVLGEKRDPALKPLLSAALQDRHSEVRLAAHAALEQYEESEALVQQRASVCTTINHIWQVFISQFLLLKRFLLPGLPSLALLYIIVLVTMHNTNDIQTIFNNLTWIALLFTGAGIAFSSNIQEDDSFEITACTPTSFQIILLSRFCILIGLQFLLALGVTVVLAFSPQLNIVHVLQFWLLPLIPPLLFVASLALTLTVLIKSWFTCLVLSCLPILRGPEQQWLLLNAPPLLLTSLALIFLLLATGVFSQRVQTWTGRPQ